MSATRGPPRQALDSRNGQFSSDIKSTGERYSTVDHSTAVLAVKSKLPGRGICNMSIDRPSVLLPPPSIYGITREWLLLWSLMDRRRSVTQTLAREGRVVSSSFFSFFLPSLPFFFFFYLTYFLSFFFPQLPFHSSSCFFSASPFFFPFFFSFGSESCETDITWSPLLLWGRIGTFL
ncbi:uncharacterized protein K489DRAFT_249388 [Dissoconium aciculare CBS 342.82]|uniref:Uncharacterized protein n=1 Tax=Dissoconium aciculare CBS 342.82 TaxID=1314786 RepID=A0A6J3M0H4_9PEZI|nr:uncharacterized protein K489DRAFT_249388 [Dissoconium aciculare CBS 342.82]KAF1821521.1 hypothetical protein K489DRAFT_249388 [Dissoconium aciculare CBS 342.82]